jgi:hypothetical protein
MSGRGKGRVPIGTRSESTSTNWAGYIVRRVKTERGWRWVFEHRLIWEDANGPIPPGGRIHHLNEDKTDNRLDNLALCESNSQHYRRYHHAANVERGRRMGASGKGKPKSPEHRAKIAAAHKGKPKSEEHKRKMSEIAKHRRRSPDGRLWI